MSDIIIGPGICDCCRLLKSVADWTPEGSSKQVVLCGDCRPTNKEIDEADRVANEQVWDAAGR